MIFRQNDQTEKMNFDFSSHFSERSPPDVGIFCESCFRMEVPLHSLFLCVQFKGIPSIACIAIGKNENKNIVPITIFTPSTGETFIINTRFDISIYEGYSWKILNEDYLFIYAGRTLFSIKLDGNHTSFEPVITDGPIIIGGFSPKFQKIRDSVIAYNTEEHYYTCFYDVIEKKKIWLYKTNPSGYIYTLTYWKERDIILSGGQVDKRYCSIPTHFKAIDVEKREIVKAFPVVHGSNLFEMRGIDHKRFASICLSMNIFIWDYETATASKVVVHGGGFSKLGFLFSETGHLLKAENQVQGSFISTVSISSLHKGPKKDRLHNRIKHDIDYKTYAYDITLREIQRVGFQKQHLKMQEEEKNNTDTDNYLFWFNEGKEEIGSLEQKRFVQVRKPRNTNNASLVGKAHLQIYKIKRKKHIMEQKDEEERVQYLYENLDQYQIKLKNTEMDGNKVLLFIS